ncbi:MAG: nickel insertion protein, partial [Anaerolineae bacterium]
MKVAYFDCFSGASGDMLLGCLLDAGLSLDELRADLARLGIGGYQLDAQRVTRHGLSGTHLRVHL